MTKASKILLPAVITLCSVMIGLACVADTAYPPASSSGSGPVSSGNNNAVVPEETPEQQVERFFARWNFYIVGDWSGSMNDNECAGSYGTRGDGEKVALTRFVREVIPQDASRALYAFDDNGSFERVPLGLGNTEAVVREIDKVEAGQGTPLNSAIKHGVKALSEQRERQGGAGYYYLIVATDGEATDSGLDPYTGKRVAEDPLVRDGIKDANEKNIILVTIGYCLQQGHPLKEHSFSYREASSPEELFEALKEVQGELPY